MKSAFLAAASAAVLVAVATPVLAQPPAVSDQPQHYGAWGVDLGARDLAVKPGDNFFDYASGGWYAKTAIPADQPSVSVSYDVYNLSQVQERRVVDDSVNNPTTPNARKIGDFYKAFMDEARIEQLDDKPLQADLQKVRDLASKEDLARQMGRAAGGFGLGFFAPAIQPDDGDPDRNALRLFQSGIGMDDRDYYLTDGFKAQKAAYEAYAARTLKAIGWPDAEAAAHNVVAMETRIAEVSWNNADRRDSVKTYNAMSTAELQALAPGFPWAAYFDGAGVGGIGRVIVTEKSAFPKIAQIYADTPLETLKAFAAFHVTDQASPYLSKRFVDSRFEFRGKAVAGVEQQRPRWKRAITNLDISLGEAVGQEYVARYFPPESKAKMQALIGNLKVALAGRIERLDWMSPATKAAALDKLAKLRVMVGYTDKWRDYSGLVVDPNDLYGDVSRSNAFEWAWQAGKLDKPVDKNEWAMNPQEVNAYNQPTRNVIVFPAAILQPPYFDPQADMAVNYGAIGGVIGHEITHGFDDQGRHYDASGKLRDWWTAQDAKRFDEEAARLGVQYDAYEVAPGAHVQGKQTMGENIADLGGLLMALDAYHASLGGRPAPVIDGLTGDQRVFLGWAQVWRGKQREDSAKQQVASDPHSPSRFRVVGPTRNIDAWYAAFNVKPGEKSYLKPEERVRIW